MTVDLFGAPFLSEVGRECIGEQAWVLRGFALPEADGLLDGINAIAAQAPYRQMVTPGGLVMSVALTNCGRLGWISDEHGYRYAQHNPENGQTWPVMPDMFQFLAKRAAAQAGFEGFVPDACLINRYVPGARMSLHQDKNERDRSAPIVSVSLGMPAMFLFGGHLRSDKALRIPLWHGDVVVWGGVDRMRYHGVLPLKPLCHPQLGMQRINLTFRQAG